MLKKLKGIFTKTNEKKVDEYLEWRLEKHGVANNDLEKTKLLNFLNWLKEN